MNPSVIEGLIVVDYGQYHASSDLFVIVLYLHVVLPGDIRLVT